MNEMKHKYSLGQKGLLALEAANSMQRFISTQYSRYLFDMMTHKKRSGETEQTKDISFAKATVNLFTILEILLRNKDAYKSELVR